MSYFIKKSPNSIDIEHEIVHNNVNDNICISNSRLLVGNIVYNTVIYNGFKP